MRYFLLILLGLLLGRAGAAATLPADTLTGRTQFVRKLSRDLCDRLTAESQKTDFVKLSGEDAQRLLTRLMFAAMGDNLDAYQTMMKTSGASSNTQEVARQIGQDIMLKLVDICPTSRPLVAQMGMSAIKKNVDLPLAERLALAPITEAICQRLNDDNAKQPFEKMTPEARTLAIGRVMQSAMTAKAQELTDYYGEQVLEDEEKMEAIGQKIGVLMFEQCPSYILLLGRDAQQAKTQEAGPAAPDDTQKLNKIVPAKHAPTRRPAPRRPAKK